MNISRRFLSRQFHQRTPEVRAWRMVDRMRHPNGGLGEIATFIKTDLNDLLR